MVDVCRWCAENELGRWPTDFARSVAKQPLADAFRACWVCQSLPRVHWTPPGSLGIRAYTLRGEVGATPKSKLKCPLAQLLPRLI